MSLEYDKIDFADYLEKVRLEPDPPPLPQYSAVWADDPAYRDEYYHINKNKALSLKNRRKKLNKRKKRR